VRPDLGLAKEVAGRARAVTEAARAALSAYLKSRSPTRAERAGLAGHAMRLAKLDPLARARRFDGSFEEAAPEDVEDLLAMLREVPFDQLIHDEAMLLNPTFGETSEPLGGADADLIAGDTLVEFKATKKQETETAHLDQLLGYYLLARRQRRVDPTFPAIRRVAIYYCRHGYLLPLDAAACWARHPLFKETEEWFFKKAKEVFGPAPSAQARRPPEPIARRRPPAKRERPERGSC
jgi:hypothetical protein